MLADRRRSLIYGATRRVPEGVRIHVLIDASQDVSMRVVTRSRYKTSSIARCQMVKKISEETIKAGRVF
jgi:hypothetical protein